MFTKKHIRNVLREALDVGREPLRAIAIIKSDRTKNLTALLDEIRGVCSITVVSLPEPARPLSKYVEMTRCNIKFVPMSPSVKEDIKKITTAAMKVDGIYSFRIKNVAQQQKN
tara:strand:+ start:10677 stop:11015 length:339 start_codon:yes stop_codon:yes gene_type:complete